MCKKEFCYVSFEKSYRFSKKACIGWPKRGQRGYFTLGMHFSPIFTQKEVFWAVK
jgi:hypothetical protein